MSRKGKIAPAEEMPPRREPHHFIVVSYDIPKDKRRTKVSKVLADFGERVQYSVFECWLRKADLARLQQRLEPIVNAKEDDVRFYHLCETCRRKSVVWSKKKRARPRETVIVG
jgi:CRISPR-associated protein Cas2